MIIDCHQLSDASEIRGDYCVIGAGAAGITITNELVLADKDVVLLESGGRKIDRDTQALCQGEVLDTDRHGPLDQYRRRRFTSAGRPCPGAGGTSASRRDAGAAP